MSASEGSEAARGDVSAEPSTSGAQSDTPDQDVIDIEDGAALATAWGKKLREWAGPEWAETGWTYVVKPAAVGLSAVPRLTGTSRRGVGSWVRVSTKKVSCDEYSLLF